MRRGGCSPGLRVCTQINPLLQLGFRRRAVEIVAIQMCAANQRRSRCRRKTSARHGETRPTPPLSSSPTRKARLFRVQILTPGVALCDFIAGSIWTGVILYLRQVWALKDDTLTVPVLNGHSSERSGPAFQINAINSDKNSLRDSEH
jgi:hypothetical protein